MGFGDHGSVPEICAAFQIDITSAELSPRNSPLLLIRGGCPLLAVRPEDRKTYLDALERASIADDLEPFQTFMHERLDVTMGEYLSALREALPAF